MSPSDRPLLCCVDSADDAVVVRAAAQLARQGGVKWRVLHVDSDRAARRPGSGRQGLVETLQIAVQLGAQVDVLQDEDVPGAIVEHARNSGAGRIVIGAARRGRAPFRAAALSARVARMAAEFDLLVIARERLDAAEAPEPVAPRRARMTRLADFMSVLVALGLTTAIELVQLVDAVSLAMIMVLSVALVAVRAGRRAAGITIIGNLLIFDFLVVPPRFSFSWDDTRYFTTFGVMLAVGLLVGELTARLRHHARVAAAGERRAFALAAFSRDLLAQLSPAEVARTAARSIEENFRADVVMLWPGPDGELIPPQQHALDPEVVALARRAFGDGRRLSQAGAPGQSPAWVMVPLATALRARGVIAIAPRDRDALSQPEQLRELDTFAALIALALERVHYVEVAQDALIGIESERLRNSLLAALSHDLRTPLAGVIGLAESMLLAGREIGAPERESLEAIVEEGQRMASSVDNLLQMARLQSGKVSLRRDWHSIEEVIGGAIATSRRRLGQRNLVVDVAADLPLIELDGALFERVLVNLFDNAAKYSRPDATVHVGARRRGDRLEIDVTDDGPGIAAGDEEAVFAKFARARAEAAGGGLGLGLAICRAIVEAHGGTITAEPGRLVGTRIIIELPITESPQVLTETDPFAQHA